jgi:hypothetical protein
MECLIDERIKQPLANEILFLIAFFRRRFDISKSAFFLCSRQFQTANSFGMQIDVYVRFIKQTKLYFHV